ncbi:carbohydrate ABC transporter permease [Caldicellulosiruptoraceae bacterium PP1]
MQRSIYIEKIKMYASKKLLNTSFEKKKISQLIINFLIYFLLIDFAFVFIFPFIYILTNALKSPYDLTDISTKWIVKSPSLNNFKQALVQLEYWSCLRNTIIITLISALGQVISCAFVAYGLARYKFRGNNLIFSIVIFSLVIPPEVLVIPLYIQYSKMHWLNTFLPIIIPCFFGMGLRGGLFIFIFRQFFKGLPKELEEAARIDGYNGINIFFKIVLPISKPSILVTTILSIVWHWNDVFEPSVYMTVPEKSVLSMALANIMRNRAYLFVTSGGEVISPLAMAGSLLIVLPLLLIYFIVQKQFMAGIERTGLAN